MDAPSEEDVIADPSHIAADVAPVLAQLLYIRYGLHTPQRDDSWGPRDVPAVCVCVCTDLCMCVVYVFGSTLSTCAYHTPPLWFLSYPPPPPPPPPPHPQTQDPLDTPDACISLYHHWKPLATYMAAHHQSLDGPQPVLDALLRYVGPPPGALLQQGGLLHTITQGMVPSDVGLGGGEAMPGWLQPPREELLVPDTHLQGGEQGDVQQRDVDDAMVGAQDGVTRACVLTDAQRDIRRYVNWVDDDDVAIVIACCVCVCVSHSSCVLYIMFT